MVSMQGRQKGLHGGDLEARVSSGPSQPRVHGSVPPPGLHIGVRLASNGLQGQEEGVIECLQGDAVRVVLGQLHVPLSRQEDQASAGRVCHVGGSHIDVRVTHLIIREAFQTQTGGSGIIQDIVGSTNLKGTGRNVDGSQRVGVRPREAIDEPV